LGSSAAFSESTTLGSSFFTDLLMTSARTLTLRVRLAGAARPAAAGAARVDSMIDMEGAKKWDGVGMGGTTCWERATEWSPGRTCSLDAQPAPGADGLLCKSQNRLQWLHNSALRGILQIVDHSI
jgi:hypothetical protein